MESSRIPGALITFTGTSSFAPGLSAVTDATRTYAPSFSANSPGGTVRWYRIFAKIVKPALHIVHLLLNVPNIPQANP